MNYKEKFEKFGFIVLRDVFDIEACNDLKKTVVDFFTDEAGQLLSNTTKNYRDGKQCTAPHAFNTKGLEKTHIIFENEKLNCVLREITDDKLMFLHHSDAHVDTLAGKGWHTDAINNSDGRQGKKWKDDYVTKDYWSVVDGEKYCVIRLAFYLQEHHNNSDGLFVVAGSHIKNQLTKELYIKTKLGDVILFDARLQHRGNNNVKRGNKRAAIFWAMGRDNIFSQEHMAAAIARQKFQLDIESYEISKSLKMKLENNGILY